MESPCLQHASSFEERFELLVASGQSSKQAVAEAWVVLALVEQHYGLTLDEESGASLACHLAITLKRLLAGETLAPVSDCVWQELTGYPQELAFAAELVAGLEQRLGIRINRDEMGFLAVHLCQIRGSD